MFAYLRGFCFFLGLFWTIISIRAIWRLQTQTIKNDYKIPLHESTGHSKATRICAPPTAHRPSGAK